MAWFKKRVSLPQFIADLVSYQCEFLTVNFDNLIALADKSRVLTEEDKKQFLRKAHALLMVNLTMSCYQHFSANISQKEVGSGVGFLYGKYLAEFRQLPKISRHFLTSSMGRRETSRSAKNITNPLETHLFPRSKTPPKPISSISVKVSLNSA